MTSEDEVRAFLRTPEADTLPSEADVLALLGSDPPPSGAGGSYAPEHGALSDFLRMLGQGASFGFGDEIAGMLPGGDTETSRARVEEIARNRPGVALAGTLAGAAIPSLLPVGLAAQGVTRGAGLLSTMGRAALPSAIEGGLFGAGNATGGAGERAQAAIPGAVVGGAVGGLAGGAGSMAAAGLRRAAGRGSRIAQALQDATGVKVDVNAAQDAADASVGAVRKAHYAALEAAHPDISDPALISVLRSPAVRRQTSAISPDVAAGKRNPSFEEAQKILLRMKRLNGPERKFAEQIDHLDAALKKAVPGYQDANRAYARAVAPRAALRMGRKVWNKSAADIERASRSFAPDVMPQFTHGRLTEIVRRLEQRDEAAPALLKQWMDAGPEAERSMRSLFPDEKSFESFRTVLRREKSAEKINAAFKRLAPYAIGAAGGGFVAGLFR